MNDNLSESIKDLLKMTEEKAKSELLNAQTTATLIETEKQRIQLEETRVAVLNALIERLEAVFAILNEYILEHPLSSALDDIRDSIFRNQQILFLLVEIHKIMLPKILEIIDNDSEIKKLEDVIEALHQKTITLPDIKIQTGTSINGNVTSEKDINITENNTQK